MASKAKHAFGSSSQVSTALSEGKIDSFDILFLDGDTDPKIGWIDAKGNFRLVKNETDLSGVEAELATKANAEDVNAKIDQAVIDTVDAANAYTDGKVEAAINEHMVKKYEVTSLPEGSLVDYREKEIRIMCPVDAVWTKQNVGAGGNANNYYMTFKTYAPNNAVGYIEHLGDQVDAEILTDLKTDDYGRKYQPTWLGLANYNEATDAWTYYGASSSVDKYIGWNYQIDWFDADGEMIASDCIRINLSNEKCHSEIKPYYWNELNAVLNAKIDEIENKIEEVSCEVIEF